MADFNMTIKKMYTNGTLVLHFSQDLDQSKVDNLIKMDYD